MMVVGAGEFRKCCKRIHLEGDAHFLTFTCFNGQPFLRSDRSCSWLAHAIQRAQWRYGFDLWAYVFMPNHVHLVLQPKGPGTTVSDILYAIKKPVTERAKTYLTGQSSETLERFHDVQPNGKAAFRFWQRGGGYDRNLWSLEEINEKIGYIHQNPVRAGLCERTEDWQWSSASLYK